MPRREVPTLPKGTRGLVRHPALVPLSREHHEVLVHARALRRGAAGDDDARSAVRAFLEFAAGRLTGHFADEEELLVPAAERVGGGLVRPSAQRVAAEHREIEFLIRELARLGAAGGDARAVMCELGELLDDHVRFEERAFFAQLQDALGPSALAQLGEAMEQRRAERGGASCALPPRNAGR